MNRRELFASAGAIGVDKVVPKLPAFEYNSVLIDDYPLLSVDMIVRETLRLLHQQSAFINTLNAQYDAGLHGRGETLRIRVPST